MVQGINEYSQDAVCKMLCFTFELLQILINKFLKKNLIVIQSYKIKVGLAGEKTKDLEFSFSKQIKNHLD